VLLRLRFRAQFRRNKDEKDKLGLFSARLGGGPGSSAWDVTLRIQAFSERALREEDVLNSIRGVLGAIERGRWRCGTYGVCLCCLARRDR